MKREISEELIEKLLNEDLWKEELIKDCKAEQVFLTIRENRITFYHKGGKLFDYDKDGFKTHIKYAAVIQPKKEEYICESELSNCKIISDFKTNYKRIKENCSIYSGVEAAGVSEIYHKHSYLSDEKVVVLDIECSFESDAEDKTQDRIDIVLYNKDKKSLQFVEAKHFSNPEIWSEKEPEVVEQIKRYEGQIKKKHDDIIEEYRKYVKYLEIIFEKKLPEPGKIDPKVTLLVFGFDNNQKEGRLNELIINNVHFNEIKKYPIGKISRIKTENLWKV